MTPDPTCDAAVHAPTRKAYRRGCKCPEALAANTAYHRELITDHAAGVTRTIDATGSRRRIQALMAAGWSGTDIGHRLFVGRTQVHGWTKTRRISLHWADRITDLYEQIGLDEGASYRTRGRARANGWPPPIEWGDNIDDPAAKPLVLDRIHTDKDPRGAALIEDVELVAASGAPWEVAVARLGTNRVALEQRLNRMGRLDLSRRFYVNSQMWNLEESKRWSA